MKDPFQVLGIPPTASEDEIKAAYRKLARQYHPDLHPGDKTAEDKMKEVNEAYTEAVRVKKNGSYNAGNYGENARPNYGNGGYGGYGGYGNAGGYGYSGQGGQQTQWDPFAEMFGFGFGGQQQQQRSRYTYRTSAQYDDPELQRASDWIVSGRYQDALNLLNRMSAHGAPWHYLSALANMGLGNTIAARNHARQANQLDPTNAEYRDLLTQLGDSGRSYQRAGGGSFGNLLCANPCATLCFANMLLNCFCGGRYVMCC